MGEKRKPLVPKESVPAKEVLPVHVYRILFTDSSGKAREYRLYLRNAVCAERCGRGKAVSLQPKDFVSSLQDAEKAGTLNFEFGTEDNFGRIFEHVPNAGNNGDSVEIGRIHSLSCRDVLKEILNAKSIEVIYKGREDVSRNKLDCPDVIRKKRKMRT
jgi:hypothetical protein